MAWEVGLDRVYWLNWGIGGGLENMEEQLLDSFLAINFI